MATVADVAGAPGGGSLALTGLGLQFSIDRGAPSAQASRVPGLRHGWRRSRLLTGRGRRKRLNRQCVDIARQHVIHGRVNQAVAGNGGHAAKDLGHYPHAVVAVTAGGTRMTGMQVTLVFNDQLNRCEPGNQPFAQTLLAGWVAHSADADLVLPFSHRTCGIMKMSVATLMPTTLKLTHVLSEKFCAM